MTALSDVMSAAGLHSWAELALIVAFVTFVGVLVYLLVRRRQRWEHMRSLPLSDGRPVGSADGDDSDRRDLEEG